MELTWAERLLAFLQPGGGLMGVFITGALLLVAWLVDRTMS